MILLKIKNIKIKKRSGIWDLGSGIWDLGSGVK